MARRSLSDILEAYYLAKVLDALHQTKVLQKLQTENSVHELAAACNLNPDLLSPLLDFVATRSMVLRHDSDDRYALEEPGARFDHISHMLDQYVGGYGPVLSALPAILAGQSVGREFVDRNRHAKAFSTMTPLSETAQLVLSLGATRVVDLGCGGAQTLCHLAANNPELTALGIDGNPFAIESARSRVDELGFADQIELAGGDALSVLGQRSPVALKGIQIILASSLLNEFWGAPGHLSKFLEDLGSLLPGRILLVSDYYGQLGSRRKRKPSARTLIHDVAQAVSGQGVPASKLSDWRTAYSAAGCRLLWSGQASTDGIDRFIHLVKLPD